MAGETDLAKLLASMSPALSEEEYVFCTLKSAQYGDHLELQPVVAVRETEGLTLVVPRTRAEHAGLSFDTVFRQITLRVHSSLDAVGLTAALSNKLAEHGLSANVVAGYYHDHIFIQSDNADKAIAALGEFSS